MIRQFILIEFVLRLLYIFSSSIWFACTSMSEMEFVIQFGLIQLIHD